MQRIKAVFISMALLAYAGQAMADMYFDAGVKLWYAEPKVTGRALMYGPSAVLSVDDLYWARGFYLYGDYDYVRDRATREVQDFSSYDAELSGGINLGIFHVGGGIRWASVVIETEADEEAEEARRIRTPQSYGPVIIAGLSQSFAEPPWGFTGSAWGWYAGTSWMFYDVKNDKGEHINFEAGITHMSAGIYKSLGYRFKHTFDHERMEGFMATIMFEF